LAAIKFHVSEDIFKAFLFTPSFQITPIGAIKYYDFFKQVFSNMIKISLV